MSQNIVRIRNGKVSNGRKDYENATLQYEGTSQPYEDFADYLPRNITLKGVRIA